MTALQARERTDTRPPPGPGSRPADTRRDVARWRLRHLAVCVLFAALCLNSDAGRLTPDTKLDLAVDPGRFLARQLHLWDAQGFAGQLQNQGYGYLFPMGPFFWVAHVLGVPPWVAQRLWWTLLLSTAFLGVVFLARALRLGSPSTRMIAGCAYACSPHVLTLLGANSVESLPMCVAPWLVLPLVRATQGWPARRAGMLFGLGVLCLGGVNAAADAAALVPAALWLLTRRPGRRTVTLAGWAAAGGVLAAFWWLVPLVLLGRYSPPFLDYIENARTTTTVTPLAETLRGTADWVPYLPSSGWHAGLLLLTSPVLVLASMLVAAVGLAGVAATRSPHRGWLLACLAVGLLAVTFGHVADVGPLFGGGERSLLDGALAPLRNVHKFDLALRLPLVLGLADLLTRLRFGDTERERAQTSVFLRAVAAAVVLLTAGPMLTFALADTHGSLGIPGYWQQTASWLGRHAGPGRALLVPASPTPAYLWGTPTDEPLQTLARSPWEVRNNVPLTTPGHIRMLDEIDALLATGTAQPTLSGYLARNGIRYLVVRNDLDYRAVGALAPAVVSSTLGASPGLHTAATFGPVIGTVGDAAASVDQGLEPPAHAVEVWRVTASGDPRVTSADASSLVRLSGGPESVAQLAAAGVDAGDPTVLTGQSTGGIRPGRVVLTDGLRRREVNYGGASGQHSDTLTSGDPGRIGRRTPDYLPVAGVAHQSVVRYPGARAVTASSSGADATGFFAVRPDEQPYAALDGDPATAWRTAPGLPPAGQWLDVALTRAVRTGPVTVQLPTPSPVTELRLTTSHGSVDAAVGRSGRVVVPVPGSTDRLRVTIVHVAAGYTGTVGITELRAAGLHVGRTVLTPRDLPTGRPADVVSLATPGDARTGCLLLTETPHCVVGRARGSEDGAVLDRTVTLPAAASYRARLAVTPRAGAALDALLSRAAAYGITATASSQAVPDPLGGAQSAVDGDASTAWVASVDDRDPSITLHLPRPTRLTQLNLADNASIAATRPDLLRITSPAGTRTAVIGADDTAHFAPLVTTTFTLHLASSHGLRRIVSPSVPGELALGIGVVEISAPELPPTTRAATTDLPVRLPCGQGPTLTVDGRRTATSVTTTVGRVRDLRTVPVTLCGTDAVALDAGVHRIVAGSTPLWAAQQLTLTRTGAAPSTAAAGPAVRVRRWGNTTRSVHVAARTEPALLVVNENENPAWHATLDGRRLAAVTVDGWRQGYVLPTGSEGTVHLAFGAQRTYALALGIGAGGVVLLLVLLAAPLVAGSGTGRRTPRRAHRLPRAHRLRRRRPEAAPPVAPLRLPRPVVAVLAVAVCTLLGGLAGAVTAAGTVAALVLLGPRLSPLAGRLLAPVLAGGALVLAGAVLCARHFGTLGYAADTPLLQVLCVVGVAAAVVGVTTTAPDPEDVP